MVVRDKYDSAGLHATKMRHKAPNMLLVVRGCQNVGRATLFSANNQQRNAALALVNSASGGFEGFEIISIRDETSIFRRFFSFFGCQNANTTIARSSGHRPHYI
jgi:hypothetical protein